MKQYNWETVFDTANRTMTHIFKNALSVVVDFKNAKCSTLNKGRVVDTIDFSQESMTMAEYERHLLKTAEADDAL